MGVLIATIASANHCLRASNSPSPDCVKLMGGAARHRLRGIWLMLVGLLIAGSALVLGLGSPRCKRFRRGFLSNHFLACPCCLDIVSDFWDALCWEFSMVFKACRMGMDIGRSCGGVKPSIRADGGDIWTHMGCGGMGCTLGLD